MEIKAMEIKAMEIKAMEIRDMAIKTMETKDTFHRQEVLPLLLQALGNTIFSFSTPAGCSRQPYGGPSPPGPGQMPSPGFYGAPPEPAPYGGSPGSGDRGFGGSSGGFGSGLLNSAINKAASKAGFTPPSFGSPAGPPPGSNYQTPSGPPPSSGYGGGRDYGSGPNSIYNNFNGPSSNPPRPHEVRQDSFPYQPPGQAHMPPTQTQYYGPQMGTPGGGQQQPSFMYSQCTGKKKGLIIGINYFGTDQELGGCINDARNMKNFIARNYGYRDEDVVILTDDAQNPVQHPTRSNIIRAMEWLVRGAQPNDSLFFHYSGHGGLTKDTDGDEEDGWDEVIYPMDYKETDHIVDDEMHEIMVRPLPEGCRLTAIFDSCHSGSALDLPYIYSTEGKIKEPNLYVEAGSSILSAASAYSRKDFGGVLKGVTGLVKAVSGSQTKAEEKA
ncbi:Ca(2+)-dependent cysteine protease [Tulasnella sp. 427]|nr:Ca(2+)-dependent cysteine protease [Tulasnella sp. 427]